MIDYHYLSRFQIEVLKDNQYIGDIKVSENGYRFYPASGKPGDFHHSLNKCRDTLENIVLGTVRHAEAI